MKRYLLWALFLSLFACSLHAQDWVTSFGHEEGDVLIEGVVTDSENNIVITGTFSSEEFKPGATDILKSRGREDVYIIKYDPLGGIIWSRSFGGMKEDFGSDIALDSNNNIYVTGHFSSNAIRIGDTDILSAWPENVYVAKFDPSGEFIWLRMSEKLTRWSKGTAVFCDGDQNIFFTGYTSSMELSFGDINLSAKTSSEKGFYCKLDAEGNFMMADFMSGSAEERYRLNDICTDTNGNIYLAGSKTIHTEPDPVTYQEYRDVLYFCKLDPFGEISWTVEDTSFYQVRRMICQNDSLFILGNREEFRMIFNGGTIDTTSSFFFGIFDTDSNNLMGRKVTGALAYDLYADNKRILVAGGLLLDHLELDGFQIHRNSDSSSICPIYQDIFYFETNLAGEIKQLKSISGSLEDIPTAIWLSDRGDLLYSGIFESASVYVEETELFNFSELNTFMHVSGTYYNRRIFSFLASKAEFGEPGGTNVFESDQMMIYPNPSQGVIHIRRSGYRGTALVKVHDLTGYLLYEKLIHGDLSSLDLSDLEAGMFVLTIIGAQHVLSNPLLIIK
ncbi:MAG: T9SS type A sorting domain-containing protein [Bacteroidetes bacterium]|nr:T9SS type A sorting domain-containing protein [Bacteroidota bacterium]